MIENLGWTCPQCKAGLSPTTTICPNLHAAANGWNPYPYPSTATTPQPYTYHPFQFQYGTNNVPQVINCSTCYE